MTTWIIAAVAAAAFGAAGYFVGLSRGREAGHADGHHAGAAAMREVLEGQLLQIVRDQTSGLADERQKAIAAVGDAYGRTAEQIQSATGSALESALKRIAEADQRRTAELDQRRKQDVELMQSQLGLTVREPIEAGLARLTQLTNESSQRSQRAYGQTLEAARKLESQVSDVTSSAQSLREALKGDRQARGRWGEIQLTRLVEVAGLNSHVDFETQQTASDGGRPDMVLHLPHGNGLAVDSKAPMDNYLRALGEDNNEQRTAYFKKHADDLRNHIRALSRRKYNEALRGPGFTVLFLPLESLLTEAVRHDATELLQFSADHRVVLTTPHSLLAILWGVAGMWQQAESSKNAAAIQKEASDLHQRIGVFLAKFAQVGKLLGKTADGYNAAVASAEARMLPSVRRIAEMRGVEPPAEAVLPQVEGRPRTLALPPAPEDQAEPRKPSGPVPRRLLPENPGPENRASGNPLRMELDKPVVLG